MKKNFKILLIPMIIVLAEFFTPSISLAVMNFNQNQREGINEEIRENIQEKREEWKAKWQEIKDEHKKWQEERQDRYAENKNKLVCENIEKWVVRIDQVLTEKEMKIEEKQIERAEVLAEKRDARNQKLEQHREKWEEKWEEHFGLLEEKASTSEQKQALIDFKEAVEEARASRQAAVDFAISEFRTELDKLVADRKTLIEGLKNTYINAYNTAVQNAKQACLNGEDSSKIRENLRTQLKAVKDEFNAGKKEIEKTDIKDLVEKRQQAFNEALEYFKKAMEKARNDLKNSFNQ